MFYPKKRVVKSNHDKVSIVDFSKWIISLSHNVSPERRDWQSKMPNAKCQRIGLPWTGTALNTVGCWCKNSISQVLPGLLVHSVFQGKEITAIKTHKKHYRSFCNCNYRHYRHYDFGFKTLTSSKQFRPTAYLTKSKCLDYKLSGR